MALVLADRVLETTTTTGSGTITLAGAEPGYQSFSVIGNANQTYYTITADTAWEVGIGTYTASGTTLSRDTVLASSNSGNRITLPAGSKKVFVTYPAEKSVNFDVSGNISALSGVITNVGYPSDASDAATKLYVDTLAAQGITYHTPVKYEVPNSTGNLTATYNNGTAGVSATLTNAGTLAAFVPDGVTATISDRVLIYNQTNGFENGVYTVTTVGNGSTAWVLTRATDADTYALKSPNGLGGGDAFYVTSGNTGAGETYLCNNSGVITFGSTAISFVQISAAQVYSAGNGLSLTNTVFSLATPVAVANGGTGTSATPTNGQLLIGNGSGYTLATLTAGSGVSITNSAGSITLTATGLGGTVTNVTASAPLASSGGTTPNISIANSTGTGSVVLDQGATISSATITAALSASITTITGTSANITTVTGTTAGFSSANITQLSGTSAGITTVTGTTTTFSSGTITQFGATSATVATISGTNVTYSNGNFTSATVTNLNSTSANIATLTGTTFGTTATTQLRGASGAITTLSGTTVTYSSGTITNLAATSITVTNTPAFVGNGTLTMNVSGTGLSGSQTFTANQASNATFTVTSNATSANTASTIVARDASGNFSAGTITATLNGNASTATSATSATTATNVSSGGQINAASATITTITATSSNITTLSGTTLGYSGTSTLNKVNIGGATTASGAGLNVSSVSSGASPITAKTTDYATVWAVLPWASGTTYICSGVYYNGGAWVHASSDSTNCLLAITGNSNTTWYASNNSSGSWNVASAVPLWSAAGVLVAQISSASATITTITSTSANITTLTGTTLSDGAGNVRSIPSAGSTKTSPYTLATTDNGEHVTVGSGGSITVPNSTFAAGNAITIYNDTTGGISINISLSTCYIAGTNTNRTGVTLATRGLATILFISSTQGVISGNVT